MPIGIRRLPSNVQAERLKGSRRPSEHASNRRTRGHFLRKKASKLPRNGSPPNVTVDPPTRTRRGKVPSPQSLHAPRGNQNDNHAFERRVDQALRRARRLDEQIVRTIATSTFGLLAQRNEAEKLELGILGWLKRLHSLFRDPLTRIAWK